MTKKSAKILSAVIILLIAIVITLMALVKIFITPENVRVFLVHKAEKTLSRKVNVGEVNISLFKGIEVKDLIIKEIDEKTDFIKCRDFVLKYKLLPLLYKKVIVDELKLISAEIRIKRDSEGKFNFQDIGQKQKPEIRFEPEEVKRKEQVVESKGLPISLLINRVLIKDARFSLVDLKKDFFQAKGAVDINMGIKSVGGEKLFSQGDIDLKLDEVVLKKPDEKHIKNITSGVKYAIYVNLRSDDIHIEKGDLRIQEIPVSITGDVKNFKTSPEIDMSVSLPKTKTADIQKSLAPFVDMKGLALSGNLTADLTLKGMPKKFDSLKIDGIVTLEKIGIAKNNINTVFDGNLKFNGQSISIDLKNTTDKNTANLNGSVSSYFKNPKINLNLYSKQLFLDELIPVTKDTTPVQKGKATRGKSSKPREAKPLDLKLTAEGEIKIDSAIYKGMAMNNFSAKYQLKNNKLEILEMTADVGKGKFNLNSIVDLSKHGYTYRLYGNLDSLHADEVINSLFPKAKDTIFGMLSINLNLSGAGTLPESIKKNLIADGDFDIKKGKITNNKIAENLSLFLGIDELRTINLNQADGTVKIRNSNARLDSIFSSDDISMDPSGNIGLDETLALAFDLRLSPRLTDKAMKNASIASYIKDEEGWGRIPIKVLGTFADPSYSVDVEKAGKRVIKKKAKELLEDLFKKDKDEQKETEDQKPDIKKPIEELFKGLFK